MCVIPCVTNKWITTCPSTRALSPSQRPPWRSMLLCFKATLLTLLLSSLIYVSCKLSTFIACMSCHVCHILCMSCVRTGMSWYECMSCMMRLCISIGFSDDRRFSLGKVRICVNTKRRQVEAEKGRSLGVAVSFFPLYVLCMYAYMLMSSLSDDVLLCVCASRDEHRVFEGPQRGHSVLFSKVYL